MPVPTVWPKEPHTEAKHRILEEYLKAWFAILSRHQGRILYIDGFAGPGIYKKGEIGSPIIALQCLLDHSLKLYQRSTEFNFFFIEKDEERVKILEQTIKERFPDLPKNVQYGVFHVDFEKAMSELLGNLDKEKKRLAPTFAFIDPFGYSGLPFNLIRRILSFPRCEVFINFAFSSINRFIETEDSRTQIFDNLFETGEWRKIREIQDPITRNRQLVSLYADQLKSASQYVRSFEMEDTSGRISYYLFFATNHIKGFVEMKSAMWRVDPRGSFRFADTTDAGQRFLLSFDEDSRYQDQAEFLYQHFIGRTVSGDDVIKFCEEDTGYPTRWSKSLKILEDNQQISVTNRKRKNSYPPDCEITFNRI